MKRIVGGVLTGLIVLFLTALADPVFEGPEGDLYLIDDGSKSNPITYPEKLQSNVAVRNNTTDTVIISQLDCGMFPTICLYVDVLDSAGYPVGGLTADSFCISQDGNPIDSFSIEELTLDSCITSVALVIDVSGSMNDNNKIAAARNAAHSFVNNMDIYDRVAIITFGNCYTVVQNFTSDQALLHSKINTISANGWTAAFDGIWKGVDLTRLELGSKAVIAMSDGMENYSQNCGGTGTPDGLWIGQPPQGWWPGTPDPDGWTDDSTLIVNLAQSSGIPIYTISLGNSFDPQYLIDLAVATGGSYNHAPTGNDIALIYDEIKQRLCSRYLICYTSPDTIQNGDWHVVTACRRDELANCEPCDVDSCQEIDSPEITRTPTTTGLSDTCARWDTSVEICTWVVDLDTPQEDLEVKLYYRNAGNVSYTSVIMNRTDSLYCYTIPASVLDCDADSIQYYITASDGQVTVSSPALAPTYHYAFAICENYPPTVFAGNDTTVAQCTPAQICWNTSASDPDGNLKIVEKIIGPGTFNGTQICFTPTGTLDYEFVLRATDSCGLTAFDTVVVHYYMNRPPVANAGRDSTLFLCSAQQICWTAGCSDPDGNLSTCTLVSPVGSYNGTNICFTPDTAGVYRFIMQATDACGQTKRDTSFITVTFNHAPVCNIPDDTAFFQCTPAQVSLPVGGSDIDGNFNSCQIMSGPGSLIGGNWVYTPSASQVVTVVIRCTDNCGAYCEDQFMVNFTIDAKPTISLGPDRNIFQCSTEEICIDYTISDPDPGQSLVVSLLTAVGTVNQADSTICFTPDTAGQYRFIAQVEDPCGKKGYDTVKVTVSFNAPPVANAGSDQTLFQCSPTTISWAASCSDPNGNLSSCQLISPVGSYNGTQISFTPTGTGIYEFILKATDACGLMDYDTSYITVTLNSPPVITAQADTTLFLCQPQSVCVSYSVSDPDGLAGIVETMFSGYGAIDTLNNQICFTPISAGSYTFIVEAADPCGQTDRDTVIVTVAFGQMPQITCPTSAFNKFLCGPDSILQTLAITPDSAHVTLSNGIYANGMVRFYAPTEGTYNITVIAAVQCGADTCEMTFNVDFNSPPVANAGNDQNIFQCTPAAISWAASCSDVDGNLATCQLVSGIGSYNGSNISFTPTGTGIYEFILKATDACGAEDFDTAYVTVTLNSPPIITAQADTSLFLCQPQSVCVSYSVSDPDGLAGIVETMFSGYGAIDTLNNQICFTPISAGSYTFIVEAADPCGQTDRDTVIVTVAFGQMPQITCPTSAFNKFLCGPDSILQTLAITPDSAHVTLSNGIYANGMVRFYAPTEGTYNITVIAAVQCGADTCEMTFNVDFNSPPVANAGNDQNIFQCTPAAISWAASCSDVDGNLATCQLVSGIGSYNGSNISFTPTGTGIYEFILKATDACGAEDYDTAYVTVTLNSAPTVIAQDDNSFFLCQSQQICVTYTPSDPDGLAGLVETMVSGYGSIDTAGNQICFTPTADGNYEFIIEVEDACGLTDRDTVVISVTFGEFAHINCPPDTIFVSLCDTTQVCSMLGITPDSATVSVSLGSYAAGQHCFLPDSSGIYIIEVIAEVECGADTCQLIYKVDIGQAADIACPGTQTRFICAPGQVCVPISVLTPEATFDITPIGSYNAGNICFTADTTGHYVITVIASTSCGADTCQIVADVTINSNPVAVNPTTPVDTFLCAAGQICYQFAASDIDGGALTWTKLSGNGAITSAGNWCFNATATGTYTIVAKVADACGAADTTTLTYNVTINSAPVVTVDDDVTTFLCSGDSYCFGYTVTDANNNVATETLFAGSGAIDTVANQVCFTPPSGGVYQFIVRATDACGVFDQDTINITINMGYPVTVACPADTAIFLCGPVQICRPVTIPVDTNVIVSPIGTYSGGQVCFTADTAGHYVITVQAISSCGSDDCQIIVDVTMNSAPVAVDPSPVDTFLCVSGQICHQFEASDVDGGTLVWSKLSGDGTINASGYWCFNVSATGTKTITARVTDPCGAADTVTMTYNVTMNTAPVVTFGDDFSAFLCQGDSYCVGYSLADADNNIVLEALVNGPGTIDTLNNQVCFTPPSGGVYQFIVRATDACGAFDQDTINITINMGYPVTVTCPADTAVFLCGPAQICRPVTILVDTNVMVSPIGTYNGGQVCFNADTAGHYVITVQAISSCGSDDCQIIVDVTMNSAPVAYEPPVVDTFICAAQQICMQLTANDIDGGTLVWSRLGGDGTVDASGMWCFTASAAGSYDVTAVVTDPCGAADTIMPVVNVDFNSAPYVQFGNDTTIFQCAQAQVCVSYTLGDADNNIILEELIDGGGIASIDTLNNMVCFTPAPKTPYTFILQVTDACGAIDRDTVNVTADVNHPPVADAGENDAFFLCAPQQLCFDISCTDEDGNLDACQLVAGIGGINGSQVCFTPDTSGVYTFIIEAIDQCDETDRDTVQMTVTMNTAPVCNTPADTTFFLCAPTQITRPVGGDDVDGNFDHCLIVSGPGSIVGGNWTHTPSTAGTSTVVIKCLDDCGAFCQDTFTVTVAFNRPPVPFAGDNFTHFSCQPGGTICWDVYATDPDNNLKSFELISSNGTYNPSTGQVCFTVPQYENTYKFIFRAIDSCDVAAVDTALVQIDLNAPPVINLPPDFTAYFEDPTTICFNANISDPDNNLVGVTVSPTGTYSSQTGKICFYAMETGSISLEVTATDNCGAVTRDTINIDLEIDECIRVQIEKVHNQLQGHYATVDIDLFGSAKELGGFDLLIAYDQSALTFMGAVPGQLFTNCDWEYFTYRFGPFGNCGSACPSGMLRIVGMAETNNGAYHPDCYLAGAIGPIAVLNFLVSNDYTLGCQYAPIRFFWLDCGDNTFSSRGGDTLWTSRLVYDFQMNDITDNSYGFPGYYGAIDSCMIGEGPGKPRPERCIDFVDGGIDIICPDSIDARGDVNLNGIAYEIADAVVFVDYFIYGLSAFTISIEGQTAATDVNADGIALTVADLAYLIRVIVGDALPVPKPVVTERYAAEFELLSDMISVVSTEAPISVMRFTFEGKVIPELAESAGQMEMKYHFDGVATRVLLCNFKRATYIEGGPVLRMGGKYNLKSIEIASAEGQNMIAKIDQLPTAFRLEQNYPNPFNPTTTITFALPHHTDWKLAVYNILGQTVQKWSGSDEGIVTIDWNAENVASGVYFYKLVAGDFNDSKTMVLLK